MIERPDRDDKITIFLLGAENPAAILGMYLDGVVFDEFVYDPSTMFQEMNKKLVNWKLLTVCQEGC